jgi:hypothetical protein
MATFKDKRSGKAVEGNLFGKIEMKSKYPADFHPYPPVKISFQRDFLFILDFGTADCPQNKMGILFS